MAPSEVPDTWDEIYNEYDKYRLEVRGIGFGNLKNEHRYIERLIDEHDSRTSPYRFYGELGAESIKSYLTTYARNHGFGSREWMHRVLRSFLRFSSQMGYIDRDLSILVPSLRRPSRMRLSRGIPENCIVSLEAAIDRNTVSGMRDYAIIGLLHTYGVRGVQVRRLRLEDIDWEKNIIRFGASKGGRELLLPLLSEVGNRLVDYLKNGRPESAHREVFLSLKKPFAPMKRSGQISALVGRRLRRSHIELPEGISSGTHGFRHAFAERMIGRVGFKDLVDLLGHRDPSSTLIYAKVDLSRLSKAALPWPGGES